MITSTLDSINRPTMFVQLITIAFLAAVSGNVYIYFFFQTPLRKKIKNVLIKQRNQSTSSFVSSVVRTQ